MIRFRRHQAGGDGTEQVPRQDRVARSWARPVKISYRPANRRVRQHERGLKVGRASLSESLVADKEAEKRKKKLLHQDHLRGKEEDYGRTVWDDEPDPD